MPKYTQFKFQPNSSIHAKVINILENPRWRRPPSWIFLNFTFLMKFSNFPHGQVCSVQISAKKLNLVGRYLYFIKSKMAADAILDFSKFSISDEIFQFLVRQGIRSSNFSQKAQSTRKLLRF